MRRGAISLAICLAILVFGAISHADGPTAESGSARLARLEKEVSDLRNVVHAQGERLAILEESLHLRPDAPSSDPAPSPRRENRPTELLDVKVANKRFDPSDIMEGQVSDYIWYDPTYVSHLAKPTRSLKGVMQFCDLFGDSKFQIRVTIDKPLNPGKPTTTPGVGFEYNEFLDGHRWMRTTSLNDMTFKFKVTAVLYADGTREDFE